MTWLQIVVSLVLAVAVAAEAQSPLSPYLTRLQTAIEEATKEAAALEAELQRMQREWEAAYPGQKFPITLDELRNPPRQDLRNLQ
jgi:flagellar biosynthesis chaperone FliJ